MTQKASLQQKLERYSTTARGQIIHSLSAVGIAGYAAAAGAALSMASAADASIVYSGLQNLSVQINPNALATTNAFVTTQSINIDLDGGGTDINAFVGFAAYQNSAQTAAKYIGAGLVSATGGAQLLQGTTGIFGAANLAASNRVGPGGSFGTGPGGFARLIGIGSTNTSFTGGNFALGVTGIVGIQLGSGTFGWIRLRLDDLGLNQPFGGTYTNGQNFPDQVTVIDWAYENRGAAIHVADTTSAVPEPSSLLLLASGAAGIAALRRRKAKQQA